MGLSYWAEVKLFSSKINPNLQPQEVCHASVLCRYIRHDHLLDSWRNGDRNPCFGHNARPIGASSLDCNSCELAHRAALRNVPGLDVPTDESERGRTSQKRHRRHSGFRSLPSSSLRHDSCDFLCERAPDRNGLRHSHDSFGFHGEAIRHLPRLLQMAVQNQEAKQLIEATAQTTGLFLFDFVKV